MSLATTLYNVFGRRNSAYVPTILGGAFLFGIGLNIGTDAFWNRWNKGKQWQDIRHKYIEKDDDE